ncbi:MAG: tetratricopeptide repeat protein [Chitinophagaceae bacterium]|jgi:tetratricopeptide (TPR) repeat protein|nr:tetratricopeptide repeat protein [Chitinophagaceae bacterium]
MVQGNDRHLARAEVLIQQGRLRDAEKEVRQALQTDPQSDKALAMLGRVYIDGKRPNEGIPLISQAIGLCPDEDYYLYLRAFGYYQLNLHAAAEQDVMQAIALNPWNAGYFALHAFILLETRRFSEALSKANEGLMVDAEDINCLNAQSTALVKLNRLNDAEATIKHTLRTDPENNMVHLNAGYSYLEKGRHRDAAHHFRQTLRLNPGSEAAREGLKDALRSKIPPYRWMLQYSYWLQNKGHNMRVAFVIGIYIGFRVLLSLSDYVPKWLGVIFVVLFVLYVIAALLSWVLKPVSNLFLSLHPEGRYALTREERLSSLLVGGALAAGLLTAITYAAWPAKNDTTILILLAAGVLASMAIPLSYLQFPLRQYQRSYKQWAGYLAVLLGIGGLLLLPFYGATFVFAAYLPVWVIGTWVATFSR